MSATRIPSKKPLPGIFLLPNLFTTAALMAGFYALVTSMDGRFETAVVAVLIALVLDGADGRIARLTNTQSTFGAEYDSLADAISFGVAPALIAYQWALIELDKFGWLVAFIYVAAVTLRLARFNNQIGTADKSYFQGLPCPAAAALVVTLIWFFIDHGFTNVDRMTTMLIAMVVTAGLMVSNIRFYSFKRLNLRERIPFATLLVIVLLFVFVFSDPPMTLFLLFAGYALSGPMLTLLSIRRRRAERRFSQQADRIAKQPPH